MLNLISRSCFCGTLLTVSAASLLAADTPKSALVPAEAFYRQPTIIAPALSPNGTHLAYGVVDGKKTLLVDLDISSGAAAPLARTDIVRKLFWKGNDTVVFSDGLASNGIVNTTSHTLTGDFQEAYKVKFQTFPFVANALLSSPTDLLLDSSFNEVTRLNIKDGVHEKIFSGEKMLHRANTSSYVADSAGIVRARIYQDSTKRMLQLRSKNGDEFLTEKEWPANFPPWEPQGFSEDGNALWVITRDDADLGALHSFDLRSKKLLEPSSEFSKGQITQCVFSGNGKRLLGFRYLANEPKVYWLDDARRQLQAKLESSFPNKSVEIVSTSYDEQTLVIKVGSDREIGSWYILDSKKPSLKLLAKDQPPLPVEQMATIQAVDIKARDGLVLHGYLSLAHGTSGNPAPLILTLLKEPFVERFVGGYDSDAQFWASRGYSMLRLNYRGAYGYGEKYMRAGFGEIAGRIIDDINDTALWAVENRHAQPGRIFLRGEGLSSGLAIVAATERPDLYCGVIDVEGLTDWKPWLSNLEGTSLETRFAVSRAARKDRSPLACAPKLKAPVLFVHPDPINEEEPLKKALQNSGKKFMKAKYLPLGVGSFFTDVRSAYIAREMEPFLETCLHP